MRKILSMTACLLMTASLASAQNADIAGRWEVTINLPQGATNAPLELKKDGDRFAGVFYTQQGNADVEATVKENALTLLLPPFQTQNGPINISMSGTVDGETMTGTMELGGMGQFQWSAKRTTAPAQQPPADAKIDMTGTWALDVTTSAGTGSPTIVLKQDGEKLSGQYAGQFGESPVTGRIKRADFIFSLAVDVQGTTATITYTGKVEKDTVKGTVTLAEMGEGTFVGKRK